MIRNANSLWVAYEKKNNIYVVVYMYYYTNFVSNTNIFVSTYIRRP